jgi:hypothetical protein
LGIEGKHSRLMRWHLADLLETASVLMMGYRECIKN